MSDLSQQCPLNWTLVNSPVRGCGWTSTGRHTCDSALYSVNSRTYSSVCGRILAYQRGISIAFYNIFRRHLNSIELAYVSGISLTHGRPGSRNHIWTFAGAWYEQDSHYHAKGVCPCTNINIPWPHQVPSFVGNDYFCETGNRAGNSDTIFYIDDPLWDGKGCGQTSTCCEFKHPPWFHKSLPQPTNDDLELRLCRYLHKVINIDSAITKKCNLCTVVCVFSSYHILLFDSVTCHNTNATISFLVQYQVFLRQCKNLCRVGLY